MIERCGSCNAAFCWCWSNMAMLDALELANCLTNSKYNTITEALIAYEKQMLSRTSKAQAKTKNSEDIFHSPTAIEDLLSKLEKETTNQSNEHN